MNKNDFRDSSIRHNLKKNFYIDSDSLLCFVTDEGVNHAFIIGSGPSLDKNISQLPAVLATHGGLVFVCDGSMTRVRKEGIIPDAVITAETDFQGWTNRNTTELLLTDEDIEYYKDTPLICPMWANHKFVERWKGDVYFYRDRDYRYNGYYEHFESSEGLRMPEIYPRNSTVGFHAIAVAKYLGMKAVVTLGMDYSTQGKKHHCDDFQLNGDWDVDMKSHYENHIAWFKKYYKGEFDICVTNCTQGGIMYRPSVNCYKRDLADFLTEEIPYEIS